MFYNRVNGDPRWIRVKHSCKCRKCKTQIKVGDDAFFYPKTRSLYCAGACGWEAEADFIACAQDEYAYSM